MNDRPGLEQAMFLGAVATFAIFGASGRILYRWEPTSRFTLRTLGNLMVSVFASMMAGFLFWDMLAAKPMALTAVMGGAAWLGGDIIDGLARKALGVKDAELKSTETKS